MDATIRLILNCDWEDGTGIPAPIITLDMLKRAIEAAFRTGFQAGFNSTTESYNNELCPAHPEDDTGPRVDEAWLEYTARASVRKP